MPYISTSALQPPPASLLLPMRFRVGAVRAVATRRACTRRAIEEGAWLTACLSACAGASVGALASVARRPARRCRRISALPDRVSASVSLNSPQILLTISESEVFAVLLNTVEHFRLGTVVRAAGGWVRDKLLGIASDDIDIVVDNMSGQDFAIKVVEYMREQGTSDAVSSIGEVKTNPDRSKHLATACFRLHGIWLDVNSLRNENYAQDSRIPTTSLGTPEEDARRRDFTINSLFYRLDDRSVEDLVGNGFSDLASRLIRTPLPARDTFRDDPLRVLRAVRFAARLDFGVDDGALEAASDAALHELLDTKVSRERIGIEVEKMMKAAGTRPAVALDMLRRLRLLRPVFVAPTLAVAWPPSEQGVSPEEDLSAGVDRARIVAEILVEEEHCEDLRIAMYASLLASWTDRSLPGKSKDNPLIPSALRAALKVDVATCEVVHALAVAAVSLHRASSLATAEERAEVVGAQICAVKDRWPQAVALAAVLSSGTSGKDVAPDAAAVRRAFLRERAWVCEAGLVGCWSWKPLIDGKRLMAEPFHVPKGRLVGEVLAQQLSWRFASPGLTEEVCAQRTIELVRAWPEGRPTVLSAQSAAPAPRRQRRSQLEDEKETILSTFKC